MWNGTMFVDLDGPLNASSLLSASAELLVVLTSLLIGDYSVSEMIYTVSSGILNSTIPYCGSHVLFAIHTQAV